MLFVAVRPTVDDDEPAAGWWLLPAGGGDAIAVTPLPGGVEGVAAAREVPRTL